MAIKVTNEINTYERANGQARLLKSTGSIKFMASSEDWELISIDFGGGEVSIKLEDLMNLINSVRSGQGLNPLVSYR